MDDKSQDYQDDLKPNSGADLHVDQKADVQKKDGKAAKDPQGDEPAETPILSDGNKTENTNNQADTG